MPQRGVEAGAVAPGFLPEDDRRHRVVRRLDERGVFARRHQGPAGGPEPIGEASRRS